MASPYARCGECQGNIWPPGQMKDHPHLPPNPAWPLKLKYRAGFTGRKGGAQARTGAGKKDMNQGWGVRRRAYGPW